MKERQAGYARYVEQGLTEGMWDPWEAAAAQTVIGSDRFVDRSRRGLTDLVENVNIRSEAISSAPCRRGAPWTRSGQRPLRRMGARGRIF